MTTEIKTIEQNLNPLAEDALSLEIVSKDDLVRATSILSQLNKYQDAITEEKEKITRPLNEALKAERARWKPLETLYTTAIESIRLKMTQYQTFLVQTTKAKENAIASRIGEGRGKLSLDKAISKIEALPQIEKETATEEGLVQFREKKQLKITDLSLIPDLYWIVDEAKLLEDLKAGFTITGCEIEIIQVPVNYR